MTLTLKQEAFVTAYLTCFNANRAAEIAGYSHPNKQGFQVVHSPHVAEAISQRMAEAAMTADEVLVRLAEQARSEYSKYIGENGSVDLAAMKRDNKMHLIKKVKPGKFGNEIEFHDGQVALLNIGRHHKLFVDRTEVTGDINYTEHESAAERITSRLDSIAERIRTQSSVSGISTDSEGSGSS